MREITNATDGCGNLDLDLCCLRLFNPMFYDSHTHLLPPPHTHHTTTHRRRAALEERTFAAAVMLHLDSTLFPGAPIAALLLQAMW